MADNDAAMAHSAWQEVVRLRVDVIQAERIISVYYNLVSF